MSALLAGFTLSLSLILAIGAQNAFVLKQGLKQEHVLLVCSLCAVSDAILITLGVTGFGYIVERAAWVAPLARYAGALFLLVYGMISLYSACNTNHALGPGQQSSSSAANTALTCLAFTWLNPHVYLDTVVLLGSVSTQYHPQQTLFAVGGVAASFVFFFGLGFGAKLLAPLFAKPRAWQILDGIVGLTMLTLAAFLVFRSPG